ncbi:hypothetical protein LW135_06665 [Helicobacter sp. faydin-H20]|uniref:hypothetical protein n=1 Tax=Helicobacter anatolicus TaxID=2905874 RepID=UPI001E56E78A|nr:hypothetical protein [Helicobacter anatolicus]MCE3037501.1 hypothetical protein [Helicobacter anatolicus]
METKEKIQAIDNAINNILLNLEDGISITEYSIDGITIKKKSALEVIQELKKLRQIFINKSSPKAVQFIF